MNDSFVSDAMLLEAAKTYIEITGEGREAFVRELAGLSEQVAANRFIELFKKFFPDEPEAS